jgi:hypothetical protein
MMNKILLIGSRILFIAGILLFATAIFLLNYNKSSLNSLKAKRSLLDTELDEKYKVKPLDKPFDFSDLLPAPEKPPEAADAAEKQNYENRLSEYQAMVKQEQEDYAVREKNYEQQAGQQDYLRKLNNYYKSKEAYNLQPRKREFDSEIKLQELKSAVVSDQYILQYIGTIVILIGAVGILLLGENWERAALLVFLGFAFRTVVGI